MLVSRSYGLRLITFLIVAILVLACEAEPDRSKQTTLATVIKNVTPANTKPKQDVRLVL